MYFKKRAYWDTLIHKGNWSWDSPETEGEGPQIGMGLLPYIRIEGAANDTLEGVKATDSMDIKVTCMSLVTGQVLPLVRKNHAKWEEKVAGTWTTLHVSNKWPAPKEEGQTSAQKGGAGTTPARGESSSRHWTY